MLHLTTACLKSVNVAPRTACKLLIYHIFLIETLEDTETMV